ncbi:MAG: FliH/SctL family protein [Panacagrimonas sp.]
MNPAPDPLAGLSPILDSTQVNAQAAAWTLPNFDALLRNNRPPPSASELESLEAEAAREGHARGYADGYAQGASAARIETQRLQQLLRHLAAPVAEVDAQTEQALVALMLELARRLVQQELAADPSKMLGIVRDAVTHLAQPTRTVRVRMHPDDARVVAEHLETETAPEPWSIVADRQLMPGDCIVESETARVDARLDTRQAQLAQRLLGDEA